MTDFSGLDFHDFHLQELPRRLQAGHGLIAARLARELPSLCFRLKDTDNAYTLEPMAETIAIVAGTEAETVIELDDTQWQALLAGNDALSRLSGKDNSHNDLVRWDAVLRAMVFGEE